MTDPLAKQFPQQVEIPAGSTTVRDCAKLVCGDVEFENPTICLLNGSPCLRAEWDSPLLPDDKVVFLTYPGAIPQWVWWVVTIVFAVAAYMSIPKLGSQDTPDADSAVNLTGQRNRNRLGMPIECSYGQVRIYPSLAARSYNGYRGNDQYQYSLYSLGHGDIEFNVQTGVWVEDTLATQFPEIVVQHIKAGQPVTLFRDNVNTSADLSNIELEAVRPPGTVSKFGHLFQVNVDSVIPVTPGLSKRTVRVGLQDKDFPVAATIAALGDNGWFAANDAGTTIDRIEVDLEFPAGIGYSNDKGGIDIHRVRIAFQYQEIDEAGDPKGDAVFFHDQAYWGQSITSQRHTIGHPVTPARYQVRAVRLTYDMDSSRYSEKAFWTQLRGFLPNVTVYPVDVLAVQARATNGLNDQAATKINVKGMRKLPIWNPTTGEWSEKTATRSKIWAFCDVWRSTYGANLPDEFLDLPTLYELDETFSKRGEFFDWIFDQKITVWEAARLILGSGRAVPILNGSRISAIRDSVRGAPSMVFGENNIHKDTFSIDITLPKLNDHDGLEVEYLDKDSFLPASVLCVVGDDTGDAPKNERIAGITDVKHAYQEGLYRRAREKFERVRVSFSTGRQGYLLRVGDTIAVVKEMPVWGSSGGMLGISDDGVTVALTNEVKFEAGKDYRIRFGKKDGTVTDALPVTKGSSPRLVTVTDGFLKLDPTDFEFSEGHQAPPYTFGEADNFEALCVVDSLDPDGMDRVVVNAYLYRPEPHSLDNTTLPAAVQATLSRNPPQPIFTGPLIITQGLWDISLVTVSWNSAVGARYYIIEQSNVNNPEEGDWSEPQVVFTRSISLRVSPGEPIRFRVAAVNAFRSQWVVSDYGVYGVDFTARLHDIDDPSNELVDAERNGLFAAEMRIPGGGAWLNPILEGIYGEFQRVADKVPGYSLSAGFQIDFSDVVDNPPQVP